MELLNHSGFIPQTLSLSYYQVNSEVWRMSAAELFPYNAVCKVSLPRALSVNDVLRCLSNWLSSPAILLEKLSVRSF